MKIRCFSFLTLALLISTVSVLGQTSVAINNLGAEPVRSELSTGELKGIGWFKAEEFTDTLPDTAYKVTAKAGKIPLFFREKYLSNSAGKWRKVSNILPLKLTKVFGNFEALK